MIKLKYLDTYKNAQNLAREELKTLVQDKSISLNERWELFKKFGKGLAGEDGWIQRPACFREKFGTAIEDYYLDGEMTSRHETVRWVDWVEYIQETFDDEPDRIYKTRINNPDFDYETMDKTRSYDEQRYIRNEVKMTQEDIDAFKEEIMEDFKWSFVFDW